MFAKALAKNPADRYANAGAFTAALDLKELDSAIASAIDDLVAPGSVTAAGSLVRGEGPPRALDTLSGAVAATSTLAQVAPPVPAPRSRLGWGLAAVVLIGGGGGVALTLRRGPELRPAPSEVATLPTLAPARPSLHIETDPDDAMVLVDGQEAGRAPLSIADVAVGSHQVRVTSEGYAAQKQGIRVKVKMQSRHTFR